MYIPLSVIKAGKTDEYIKLTNRREHFAKLRKVDGIIKVIDSEIDELTKEGN